MLGFLTIATGLFSLLLALTEGQDWGWTSYPTLILLTVGVLSMALFVVVELEVDEPLLDVRVFRHWAFTNSLLLVAVLSIGLFTVLFYVPLFFQQAQGLGAFETGLLLLPQALVMAVAMPIAGQLYDRIGPRWPAAIGLLVTAVGTYLLCTTTVDSSNSSVMWLLTLRAAGMGLCMMPIMTGGLSVVPPSQVSQASAFNNVVQRTTAALGLAVLTAMVTNQQAQLLDRPLGVDQRGHPDAIRGATAHTDRRRQPAGHVRGVPTPRAAGVGTPTGTSSWSPPCSAPSVQYWPSRCRPGRRRPPPHPIRHHPRRRRPTGPAG